MKDDYQYRLNNKEAVTGLECVIGIDPDLEKSGVCIRDMKGKVILLECLAFFEVYEVLQAVGKAIVLVECGYLNKKANWHGGNGAVAQRIAKNVGENHAAAKLICQMVEYLGHDIFKVKPVKTKIDSDTFEKLTGIKRSNPEKRDAYMLTEEYRI